MGCGSGCGDLLRLREGGGGERIGESEWGEKASYVSPKICFFVGFFSGAKDGFAGEVQLGELNGLAGARGCGHELLLRGERHGRRGLARCEGFGKGDGVGVGLRSRG